MLTGSPIEWLVLGGGLTLMVALFGFTRRSERSVGLDIRVGVRNGLIVGAAMIVALGVLGALALNGATFYSTRLDLGTALVIGLVIGAILAIFYVGIGLILMPLGILLGGRQGWVNAGTWLAVVPAAIAIGAVIGFVVSWR